MAEQKNKTPHRFKSVGLKDGLVRLALVLVVSVLGVFFYTRAGAPTRVEAATAANLNFQARLLANTGGIVADGTYNVEFKLYNASSSSGSSQGSCTGDAACLWTETYTGANKITTKAGYLSTYLGSLTSFPSTINWDQDLWLTIRVGGTGTPSWDSEMSPRLKLTAVPYAFRAGQLAKLTGANTSTLDFATQTAARSILLPDEGGTLCIRTSTACGFAASTGATGYIQNTTTVQTNANFAVQSAATNSITGVLKLIGSQSVDLLQLQDSSGNPIGGFNSTGQLYLGRPSTTVGQINFFGSGTANSIALKGPTSPGAGLTLTLPNETGTICSTGSVCAGYQGSLTFNNGITNTAGTVQLGGSLTQATTIAGGNAQTLTFTSDLTGGARSSDFITISQADNATNNSSNSLLTVNNLDTGSTVAALSVSTSANTLTSVAANFATQGSAIAVNITGVTSGTGVSANTLTSGNAFSSGTNLTTGNIINAALTGTGLTSGSVLKASGSASGALSAYTGSLVNLSPTRTLTSGSINDSGNFLNLTRANTVNNASGASAYTVSGALANLQSNCTVADGGAGGADTCTDTANILELNQQYASASGAVLNIDNSGSGSGINLTQTGGTGITLASTTGNGLTGFQLTTGSTVNAGGSNSTTGVGYQFNTTGTGLTTGSALRISGTASGALSAYTGALIQVNNPRTLTSGSINDTGNQLQLVRNNTVNNTTGASTYTVSGALATLQSNCTVSDGGAGGADACTDTANILSLNQQYASASGAVLNVQGAGTGNLATLAASNASANGVSVSVASNSSSQYALDVITNSGTPVHSLYVRADGNVGIGTNAPVTTLTVSSSTGNGRFINTSASSSSGGGGVIATSDDGAALASGDRLGFFLLSGSSDASHTLVNAVGMVGYAAEAFSGTQNGADLAFETTALGATSRTERLRVTANGYVGINTTSPNTLGNGSVATQLGVVAGANTTVGEVIRGAASQSADLLQLQDNSGNKIGGFSNSGQLYLGRASTTVGQVNFFGSGSANSIALAGPTSPGAGLTLTLPNETGTICSTGSVCAGYAAASGSGSYIQNTTSVQTSANFYVRSAATGSVGGIIEGANGQSVDLLRLNTYNGTTSTTVAKFSSNGSLTVGTSEKFFADATNGTGYFTDYFAAGTSSITGNQQLLVATRGATRVGATIQAAASATADILQLQDSTGANLQRTDANGNQESIGYFNNGIAGLGQYGNLLVQSEDLSTTWSASNVTVTANDGASNPAPDGQTTADKLVSTASNGTVSQTCSSAPCKVNNGTYTFSIWVKTNTSTQPIQLRIDAAGSTPTTGTAASFTATTTWQRFSVTQTETGTPTSITPTLVIVNNSATVVAWGGQVVQSSSPQAYVRTVAQAQPSSFGLIVRGSAIFQNGVNSNSALQVTNAAGTTVFNVDTTNQRVGIGTSGVASQLLSVGGATGNLTVDTSGNLATSGTATVQGANSLTLGLTGANTGSILFKGSTAASGTLTLIGQNNPSTNTLTLPNETGTICTNAASGACTATGGFVQLQSATPGTQQTGNLNISGTAIANTAVLTPSLDVPSGTSTLGIATGSGATTVNFGNTANNITQAINIGTINTTGTTNVTIGSNSGATGGTTTIQSKGTLAVGNAISPTINIQSASAGNINIGNNAIANTVQIGINGTNTGNTQTINIGNQASAGTTNVTVGAFTGATAGNTTLQAFGTLALQTAASGTVNVGANAVANTIQVGTTSTNTGNTQAIGIGNLNAAGTTNVTIGTGASATGGTTTIQSKGTLAVGNAISPTINIQGGSGGTVTLGDNAVANTIQIGTTATNTGNTQAIGIGNLNAAGTTNVTIGTGASATGGTTTIQSKGTLAVGNTVSPTINIQGASGGSITIGDNAVNNTITIGKTGTTNNTTAINIGNTTSTGGAQTIQIGGTGANNGSNSGSTVAIQGGQTNLSVANAGATIQTFTNSGTAFQVQNSTGAPIFLVDTTNSNLVTNPGFEVNTNGWAATGATASISQNTNKTLAYHGLYSLDVTLGASGTGAQITSSGLSGSALTPGTYTLSFYAKGTATLSGLAVAFTGGTITQACTLNSTTVTTGFQRFSCTFIFTTTNVTAISITTTTVSQHMYLDAVQINSGSTLTPYQIGAIQLRGVITNPVTFMNNADSTTAFQIQNAAGTSNLVIADTLNGRVGIGTSTAPGQLFSVGGTTGSFNVDSSGNYFAGGNGTVGSSTSISGGGRLSVLSGSTGQIGLAVRTFSGQTANNFEIQDVTNSNYPIFRVSATGIAGSGDTSASSTNSGNSVFRSGSVSGATSNSGSFTLRSGDSTTSGNTGAVFLLSGDATSGNSGAISINSGTATGTKGSVALQSNGGNVGIGTSAPDSTLHLVGGACIETSDTNCAAGSGQLVVNSTGANGLLRVTDTTATAKDVLVIADGGTTTFKTQTDATGSFNIQNTAGSNVFSVDTSATAASNQVLFGKASTIDAKLLFNQAASANNVVLKAPTSAIGSSYTLILPATAPALSQCLQNDGTTIGQLVFASCSGGSTTLQGAYAAGASGDQVITLNATQDSIIVRNPAASGTASTFALTVDQLNTGAKDALIVNQAGTGYALRVNDDGTSTDSTPFIIDQNGNVGIGTTNANNFKLQINQASDTSSNGIAIVSSGGVNNLRLWQDSAVGSIDVFSGGTGTLALNRGGGKVGLGTTTPVANFQVSQPTTGIGTVQTAGTTALVGTGTQFTNTFKVGDTITVSGETVRTIATITDDTHLTVTVAFSTSASGLSYTLAGGDRFVVQGNGFVGIGTTTPSAAFTVNGDLLRLGDTINGLGDTGSLVANPGFEINNDSNANVADGWTFVQGSGTPSASVTTSSPAQGANSQQITATAAQTGTLESTCFPVTVGRLYSVSVTAKGDVASTSALSVGITSFTTKANCISRTSGNLHLTTTSATMTLSYSDYSGTTSAIASGDTWAYAWVSNATPSATTVITFDNFIVTPNALNSSATGAAFLQGGNSFGATGVLGTNDANDLQLETNGSAKLTILSGGNVGIGDTTPAGLLTVGNGDLFQVSSSGNVLFQNDANHTLGVAAMGSAGVGKNLTINAGGGNGANAGGNLILQGGAQGSSGGTGSVIVKANGTDSTTAFQVQTSGGANVLTTDTTNQRVIVGPPTNGTPTGQLYVGGTIPTAAVGSVATSSTSWDMYQQDNYIYSTTSTTTLNIFDASNPTAPINVSSTTISGAACMNDIVVQGRYAYMAEGCSNKFFIEDVSNRKAPTLAATVTTGAGTLFLQVSGKYLYAFETNGNIQIFDISNPLNVPAALSTTTPSGSTQTIGFLQGKYLYAVANQTAANAKLFIYDVSNPASPVLANSGGTVMSSTNPYISVQGRYLYAFNYVTNPTAQVWDVKDPSAPTSVGSVALTTGGTGSGNGGSVMIVVQGRYGYITNNTASKLEIVDFATPASPVLVGSVSTGTNPINLTVNGRYAYVENWGASNIQVFDIGGTYSQSLESGTILTGTLSTQHDIYGGGDIATQGGLTVGQSAQVNGALGVNNGASIYVSGDNNGLLVQAPSIVNSAAVSIANLPLSVDVNSGKAFEIKVTGETFARSMFYSDGKFGIGSGSATRDVFLSRFAANQLRISSDGGSGAADLLVNRRVGIGTTSPSSLTGSNFALDVQGGDAHFTGDLDIQPDTALNFNQYWNGSNTIYTTSQEAFNIYHNNAANSLTVGYAASGTAGTTVTNSTALAVTSSGFVINNGFKTFGNEVENPGFEAITGNQANANGWQTSTTSDAANARTGNGVMLLSANGDSCELKYHAVYPGQVLYYEGYVKHAAGGTGTGGFYIKAVDKDFANAVFSTGDVWTDPGTSYTLRTNTYTVPSGKMYAVVCTTQRSGATGNWYYDDVYFQLTSERAPYTFQNTVDSATAFQIQNAGGTSNLFVANTSSNLIGIGTAPSGAQLDILNGTAANAALKVKGNASQSGDLISVLNNAGTTAWLTVSGHDDNDGTGNVLRAQSSGAAGINAGNIITYDLQHASGTVTGGYYNLTGLTTAASSTANYTNLGGLAANIGQLDHYGTGTITLASGVIGKVNANTSGGAITTAIAVYGINSVASGASISKSIGFYTPTVQGTGSLSTGIGIQVDAQTKGTDNIGVAIGDATGTKSVNLLIGTTTAPTGAWSIYNVSADANYLGGATTIQTQTTNSTTAFQVQNAAGTKVLGMDTTAADLTQLPSGATLLGGSDASGSTNSNTAANTVNAIFVQGRYEYVVTSGDPTACIGTAAGAGVVNGCELQIYDVSNPASPTYMGGADASGNTNSGTANGGFNTVFVSGHYAFVGTQNSTNACQGTAAAAATVLGCELQVYDITNPTSPTYVGGADSGGTTNGGTNNRNFNSIYIAGRYLYVAQQGGNNGGCGATLGNNASSCEFKIFDISNPALPTFVSGLDSDGTVGGTTSADNLSNVVVQGRYAYVTQGIADTGTACSGTTPANGCEFKIFDISNPAAPSYVGGADNTGSTNSGGVAAVAAGFPSLAVSGRYAYIGADGNATLCQATAGNAVGCELKIFDISKPSTPTLVTALDNDGTIGAGTNGGASYTGLAISGRYLYATNGGSNATCNVGSGNAKGCELGIYDVSNPSSPSFVGGIDSSGTNNGGNSTVQSNNVYISGHYAYVAKNGGAGTCSATAGSAAGCENMVVDISGIEAVSIQAHSLGAGTLNVDTNANINNNLSVGGSMNIGQGATIQGNLGVNGQVQFNYTTQTTGTLLGLASGNPQVNNNAGVLTTGSLINVSSTNHTYLNLTNRDLTVGGHINMLSSISNIKDIFVYDTTADRDGGRWTSDERATSSSWYNETKTAAASCVIGTNNRCGASAFPNKAILVATSDSLYIFDAQDNSLWMAFNQGTNFATDVALNNDFSSVRGMNGEIYVGTNGTAATGAYVINFRTDKITRYNATDGRNFTLPISGRNSAGSYLDQKNTGPKLAVNAVNAIMPQVVNGKTFFAAATGTTTPTGDITLVNETAQTAINFGVANKNYTSVALTSDDNLYGLNQTDAELDAWYGVSTQTANNTTAPAACTNGASPCKYDETTTPALSNGSSAPTINTGAPDALFVTNGTSDADGQSNTMYVSHANGLSVIEEKLGAENGGAVKNYSTGFISEELFGDIRGFLPLNGTAGVIANNTNITDSTVKANAMTVKNANGTGIAYGSGVRDTAITALDRTDDYICTGTTGTCADQNNLDPTSTGAFTAGAWFKRSTITTGIQTVLAKWGNLATDQAYRISISATDIPSCDQGSGAATVSVTSTVAITDTTSWHHIDCVFDRSSTTNNLKLYVDGVLIASANDANNNGGASTVAYTVGADLSGVANAAANFYSGSIDEPYVTMTALNSSQVRFMYDIGSRALNAPKAQNTNFGGRGVTINADNYNQLNSSANVKAVRPMLGTGLLYVGTAGGVSVLGIDTDTLVDLYSTSITTKDDVNTNYDTTNGNAVVSLSVSKGFGTGNLIAIGLNNAGAGGVWSEISSTGLINFLGNSYDPFGDSLVQTNLAVDRVFRVTNQISTRLDNFAMTTSNMPQIYDLMRVDSNGLTLAPGSPIAGTTVMKATDINGNNIFDVKAMGANFGSLVSGGAFVQRTSYFGEEFNKFLTSAADSTVSTTTNTIARRGDITELATSSLIAATAGSCTYSSNSNALGGTERIAAASSTGTQAVCSHLLTTQTAGTIQKNWAANNLPVIVMKVLPSAAPTANSNTRYFFGLADNSASLAGVPTNGIFFTNCTATTPTCTSSTWIGAVLNAGTMSTVTCTAGADTGTINTTNFNYLRIEVRANNNVHFFVDTNTTNGIVETECGNGVTATGPGATALGLYMSGGVNATGLTLNVDIDYLRIWQDDNVPPSTDSSSGATPSNDSAQSTPPLTSDSNSSSATPADQSAFFDFNAATSEDTTYGHDLYVKGTLYADRIKANQIEGLSVYTDQLASLQKLIASSTPPPTTTTTNGSKTEETQSSDGSSTSGGAPNNGGLSVVTLESARVSLDMDIVGGLSVGGDAKFNGNAFFYKFVTFVEKTVFNNDVSFQSHITTSGDKLDTQLETAAGITTAPTDKPDAVLANAKVDGNDISGQFTLNYGENSSTGAVLTLKFKKAYAKAPHILLTPANESAAHVQYYVQSTNDGFKLYILNAQTTGASLQFNYWSTENQVSSNQP